MLWTTGPRVIPKSHIHLQTMINITKTCLYNFDPLKPHFYIVKLGFTGVYISFLISAQNLDCEYSLEPPRRGGSNEYPQSRFWTEIRKISEFFIWKFSFFGGKIFSIYLNRRVFVMEIYEMSEISTYCCRRSTAHKVPTTCMYTVW